MAETVLLAGASGLLGRHVARALKREGYLVRALGREPSRLEGVADEVVKGDALRPDTLGDAARGAGAVVSCVGASASASLTAGWRSYGAVDTPANTNLIAAASAAGVGRFVYVSVYNTPAWRGLEYVRAHEDVVAALRASGLAYGVVRPTGFFGSFDAFLAMARRGLVPMIGDGTARTNPIHEADLADACVAALRDPDPALERDVGGPEVLTRREVIERAIAAANPRARIVPAPPWLARLGALAMRPLSPRLSHLIAFLVAASTNDCVGAATGTRTLGAYFRERTSR